MAKGTFYRVAKGPQTGLSKIKIMRFPSGTNVVSMHPHSYDKAKKAAGKVLRQSSSGRMPA